MSPGELTPCPFCGSDRIVVLAWGGDWFYGFCECQVEGPPRRSAAEAISAWNVRAVTKLPASFEKEGPA